MGFAVALATQQTERSYLTIIKNEKKMEERQELLEHWKWIVRAVFQAEYNLGQRGERINKEAEDKEKEADRWVTLVADEILSNTIDKDKEQ